MSNSRRFIAALLGVFLLQLSLPLGSTSCAMHRGGASRVQAIGHDMSDMGDASDMTGCELPAAPGQCATMAACTIVALASVATIDQLPEVAAVSDMPEPATAGSRLAGPPELPPPRA